MQPGQIEHRMRNPARVPGALACVLLLASPLLAQTHKVAKPENVVRAIAVYEWTGDMAKPAASRLIPVSLFIDGKLHDADVYNARPVPFSLLTGNVYELDRAGMPLGTFNVAFSRHLVAAANDSTNYDDGWFGYGKFVPPAPPKKTAAAKGTQTAINLNGLDEDDRPHFSSRSAVPGSGGSAKGVPGSSNPSSSGSTPADDPDRPTLHRSGGSSSTGDTTASTSGTPPDDADRPTLKRHSSEDKKSRDNNGPSVTGVGDSLNDDPNRPMLHRGKPTGAGVADADLPKLSGLPKDQDLHQLAAVSDAVDRQPHNFARPWEDEEEHQAILTKLRAEAQTELAAYAAANGDDYATTPPATTKTAPKTTSAASKTAAARTHHAAAKTPPPAPPPPALLEEQLTGYTLSYGGDPAFVYYAHTDGLGPTLRYVTLVAQLNMQHEPVIAIKNVTDAAHLDRTPRMRLVDAVDVEASNRASLLFELRAQNSRQFALYRVIGGQATQTFITGNTD